eukprot:TRINITY_DN1997_c0_g1_i1.p1 TRINITY_DN1997_c0_g1~~TRINITY_DN1997_c0_g1_i1.p1  ORF type:complete len:188 (-),score=34.28 TRINITY_DN1997_c0_g1_i1:171-734(-)
MAFGLKGFARQLYCCGFYFAKMAKFVFLYVALATFVVGSSAQAFKPCNNYQGLFQYKNFSTSAMVQSTFFAVNLQGYLNATLVTGDLQIRLINSDAGRLANDVEGIDICVTGPNGHNICNVPPSTLIIQPLFFWSYYYPTGNYVLSFEAFADTPTASHLPVLCGEYSFYWQSPSADEPRGKLLPTKA